MNKLFILGLILLTSCSEPEPLTKLQTEYLASLSLDGKVYFESCLKSSNFSTCHGAWRSVNNPQPSSNGPSTGQIAAGVAIGRILTK